MFNAKERRLRRLQALADARLFQIQTQTTTNGILRLQRARAWASYESLMTIVAAHLTTNSTHDQLRAALERTSHATELRYALNGQRRQADDEEVTA